MDWLEKLAGEWSEAAKNVDNMPKHVHIPDGPAKVLITSADPDPDRPMVRFGLDFLDYGNLHRTKVMFFSGKLEYAARELASIGITVDNLADLPMALKTVPGMVVEVNVRTKAGAKYSDMFFSRDTGERRTLESDFDPDSFDASDLSNWG